MTHEASRPEEIGRPGPEETTPPAGADEPPRLSRVSRPPAPRRLRRPVVVVYILAAANLVVGLVLQSSGIEVWEKTLETFGHERMAVWAGEYWRLLTCIFLHAGFLHLGLNLLALVLLGRAVERWFGPWRCLVGYLLSGFSGVVFFQVFSGLGVGVGASGAICGLIGMLLVGALGRHEETGVVLGARFWRWAIGLVVVLVAEALFLEALTNRWQVAVSAHLGGFVAGIFLGYLYLTPRGRATARRRWRARALFAGVLLALGIYGFAAPIFDWTWFLWRAQIAANRGDEEALEGLYTKIRQLGGDSGAEGIITIEVDRGRFADALRYWTEHPLEDPAHHRVVGFLQVYDGLAANELTEGEAIKVLDELIKLSDAALEEDRSPENLNEAAWLRALRAGKDVEERDNRERLEEALEYAKEANRRDPNALNCNTLGWVQFLLRRYDAGYAKAGLENLVKAVDLLPIGPNYLYLALAYYQAGEVRAARKAAVKARRSNRLMRHEQRDLDVLEASLASG